MPNEPALPVDTVKDLAVNCLTDAGIIGIDEAVEQPYLNRTFRQFNWLLAQWARKRWMDWRLAEFAVVSTGAQTYSVGKGGSVNLNPRPDRLEYCFVRLLNQSPPGNLPVDLPVRVIPSREDYARIVVKNIGTLPWQCFYDPTWPVGTLYPWPVPQATIYEMHFGFKDVPARFYSLAEPIGFPPEYEAAINWAGARRLRVSYQLPIDTEVNALARDAVNTIRLANTAVGTLQMPAALTRRQRAYDYRSDSSDW